MPFLSLSPHCPEEEPGKGEARAYKRRFDTQRERLKALKELYRKPVAHGNTVTRGNTVAHGNPVTYEDPVIHEVTTLDESYYHFATEDKAAQKDRHERNRDQVVLKLSKEVLEEGGTKKNGNGNNEPRSILQVNQIWIWTLDNSK